MVIINELKDPIELVVNHDHATYLAGYFDPGQSDENLPSKFIYNIRANTLGGKHHTHAKDVSSKATLRFGMKDGRLVVTVKK